MRRVESDRRHRGMGVEDDANVEAARFRGGSADVERKTSGLKVGSGSTSYG